MNTLLLPYTPVLAFEPFEQQTTNRLLTLHSSPKPKIKPRVRFSQLYKKQISEQVFKKAVKSHIDLCTLLNITPCVTEKTDLFALDEETFDSLLFDTDH